MSGHIAKSNITNISKNMVWINVWSITKPIWWRFLCPTRISNLGYFRFSRFFYSCQNQDLQIQIFTVYTALDVESTHVKHWTLRWMFFLKIQDIYAIVFCKPICNSDEPNSILFKRPFQSADWCFLSVFPYFCRIYFSPKITYDTLSFTLSKRVRENPEEWKSPFLYVTFYHSTTWTYFFF